MEDDIQRPSYHWALLYETGLLLIFVQALPILAKSLLESAICRGISIFAVFGVPVQDSVFIAPCRVVVTGQQLLAILCP